MKLWKKTLAMLMCCGFVFSTAACTDDSGSGSGSGNGDGGNEEQVLTEKKNYLTAIADSLVNAKSFKVELDASLSQSDDNSEMDMTIEGDIALSQNAKDEKLFDMGLTLSVNGTNKHDSNGDGDFKDKYETNKVEESIKLYVKDGYVYMSEKDEDDKEVWAKYYKPYDEVLADEMGGAMDEEMVNAYVEMLEKVLDNKLITGTVDAVKTGVAQTAEIKDGMFVIAFDAKALVNDTVAMLVEDPTLEEIADYALAMLDEDLTTEKILDDVAALGEKTVLEVYDEIDAWLTENYETTVQGVVELVTKDEDVIAVLEEMGAPEETIDMIESLDVKAELTAALEEAELEEATINEIIAMMSQMNGGQAVPMASEEEAPEMTLEAMVEMVKEQYLSKKLSDMAGEGWEDGVAVLEKVKANALSASFGAKYGDDNKVNYVEIKMDLDIEAANQNWEDDEMVLEDVAIAESFTVKVSNISASKSAIEFPEELEDAVEFGKPENECSECGGEGEYRIEIHSFNNDFEVTDVEYLCDDCAEKCAGYVNCGNMASHKMLSAYYCDSCWHNVTNSMK